MRNTEKEKALKVERVCELLLYAPEVGSFTWAKSKGRCKAGSRAGTVNNDGYLVITIDKKLYMAHRIAWFIEYGAWPVDQIDHINRNRLDNRISNLRSVTNQENSHNSGLNSTNTSGVRGVHYDKAGHRWCAKIVVSDKAVWLGSFKEFDKAVAARRHAEIKLGRYSPFT